MIHDARFRMKKGMVCKDVVIGRFMELLEEELGININLVKFNSFSDSGFITMEDRSTLGDMVNKEKGFIIF